MVIGSSLLANCAAGVVAIACRLARHTIRFSQMDFAFHCEKQSYWPRFLMGSLVSVLTDPDRQVGVRRSRAWPLTDSKFLRLDRFGNLASTAIGFRDIGQGGLGQQ